MEAHTTMYEVVRKKEGRKEGREGGEKGKEQTN